MCFCCSTSTNGWMFPSCVSKEFRSGIMLFSYLRPLNRAQRKLQHPEWRRRETQEGGWKWKSKKKKKKKAKKRARVVASSHKHGLFSHSAIPPPGPSYVGDAPHSDERHQTEQFLFTLRVTRSETGWHSICVISQVPPRLTPAFCHLQPLRRGG